MQLQSKQRDSPTKNYHNAVGECLALSDLLLQICGISLTPYEVEYRALLVRSALSRRAVQIPIQWARQTGKTETHVHTAMALAIYHIRWLNHAYPVAIISPARQEQSVTVTRERLRGYAERLKRWLKPVLGIDFALDRGRRTSDYVFTSSTGFEAPFHCVSASPRAFQKGQTYPLMFLEQIEDMDQFVMETNILPFGAGSDIGSVIVLAGSATPKVTNNYYYEEIEKVREREGIRPPWFVDDRLGAQYRPGYGDYVKLIREKLGSEHPSYLTQFGNVWVQPVNKPFARDLLKTLSWASGTVEIPEGTLRALGVDVAKDVDSTVLTGGFMVGLDPYIDRWLELQGLNYEKQADDAVDFIKRGGYSALKMDKNGPGNAFADMVEKRLVAEEIACQVIREPLTAETNNRIYLQYDREINGGRLHYPAEKSREQAAFLQQHLDVLRVFGAKSMMKLQAPSGRHDDFVCSGALLVDLLLNPPLGPTVVGANF
jgi:hypothetical protein